GCGRKVQCRRAADDVGGTRAVDGDAVGPVVRRAVEVARIRQGTRGGELRHERGAEDGGIGIDAGRLERPRRRRECTRHGRSVDAVPPTAYALPDASTAMPLAWSAPPPPTYVA